MSPSPDEYCFLYVLDVFECPYLCLNVVCVDTCTVTLRGRRPCAVITVLLSVRARLAERR